MKCECCGQNLSPVLSNDEYTARAVPRLATIDALSAKIDFSQHGWDSTPQGQRWRRLMNEQGRDEELAGL